MARAKQYLLPNDHRIVQKYQPLLEQMKQPDMHSLTLNVEPGVVDDLHVNTMVEIIATFEHEPIVLNKLLFGMGLTFLQIADSELFFSEEEWKSQRKYYRWFSRITRAMPFAFYFLEDYDSRFYCLTGDFLYDGNLTIRQKANGFRSTVHFNNEQSYVITERVFWASVSLMHFCFGTRVDPQPAIEASIAEWDMDFTFEDVRKEYRKQRAKGIKFRLDNTD